MVRQITFLNLPNLMPLTRYRAALRIALGHVSESKEGCRPNPLLQTHFLPILPM